MSALLSYNSFFVVINKLVDIFFVIGGLGGLAPLLKKKINR